MCQESSAHCCVKARWLQGLTMHHSTMGCIPSVHVVYTCVCTVILCGLLLLMSTCVYGHSRLLVVATVFSLLARQKLDSESKMGVWTASRTCVNREGAIHTCMLHQLLYSRMQYGSAVCLVKESRDWQKQTACRVYSDRWYSHYILKWHMVTPVCHTQQ